MYIANEARIIKESSHGYDLIPIQDEMLSRREVELVGEVNADSVKVRSPCISTVREAAWTAAWRSTM